MSKKDFSSKNPFKIPPTPPNTMNTDFTHQLLFNKPLGIQNLLSPKSTETDKKVFGFSKGLNQINQITQPEVILTPSLGAIPLKSQPLNTSKECTFGTRIAANNTFVCYLVNQNTIFSIAKNFPKEKHKIYSTETAIIQDFKFDSQNKNFLAILDRNSLFILFMLQVDFDGNFNFSKILTISCESDNRISKNYFRKVIWMQRNSQIVGLIDKQESIYILNIENIRKEISSSNSPLKSSPSLFVEISALKSVRKFQLNSHEKITDMIFIQNDEEILVSTKTGFLDVYKYEKDYPHNTSSLVSQIDFLIPLESQQTFQELVLVGNYLESKIYLYNILLKKITQTLTIQATIFQQNMQFKQHKNPEYFSSPKSFLVTTTAGTPFVCLVVKPSRRIFVFHLNHQSQKFDTFQEYSCDPPISQCLLSTDDQNSHILYRISPQILDWFVIPVATLPDANLDFQENSLFFNDKNFKPNFPSLFQFSKESTSNNQGDSGIPSKFAKPPESKNVDDNIKNEPSKVMPIFQQNQKNQINENQNLNLNQNQNQNQNQINENLNNQNLINQNQNLNQNLNQNQNINQNDQIFQNIEKNIISKLQNLTPNQNIFSSPQENTQNITQSTLQYFAECLDKNYTQICMKFQQAIFQKIATITNNYINSEQFISSINKYMITQLLHEKDFYNLVYSKLIAKIFDDQETSNQIFTQFENEIHSKLLESMKIILMTMETKIKQQFLGKIQEINGKQKEQIQEMKTKIESSLDFFIQESLQFQKNQFQNIISQTEKFLNQNSQKNQKFNQGFPNKNQDLQLSTSEELKMLLISKNNYFYVFTYCITKTPYLLVELCKLIKPKQKIISKFVENSLRPLFLFRLSETLTNQKQFLFIYQWLKILIPNINPDFSVFGTKQNAIQSLSFLNSQLKKLQQEFSSSKITQKIMFLLNSINLKMNEIFKL
ncbi:hypothetical protein M0811_10212 [Anaeramoeba ignava]|uniref:Uncharacterized protein n=1 Tax=Anaeramoeba ignava TaxID=1746090 RepID=A0A9Q0LGS6_ANAIG|nr:hypothetical protein M0811_10212 [Anaeramoeba ignava]